MHDLFELVFEYRGLLARRHVEGEGLSLPARRRLDALHRLLGREPLDNQTPASSPLGRRRHARCEVELPALLRVGDEVVPVTVVNLGAGGVCVAVDEPLAPGQRILLRISSPDTGRMYQCSAQVSWCDCAEGREPLVGLRFLGASCDVRLAS